MKVGDRVRHKDTGLEGRIQVLSRCPYFCGEQTLTFDPTEAKVRIYYHTTNFLLIDDEGRLRDDADL